MIPAVVVTGASKGIGEATVRYLDERGFRVFAGYRDEADAEKLRRGASDRLIPLRLDVTEESDVAAAAERVAEAAPGGIAGLVNNAGLVVVAPMECIPLDQLRLQLAVNVEAVVAVTRAFMPLVRRGGGRLVNVGSINGRLASPWVGAYCASKFALEALTDSLRIELRHWGIPVSLVEPGAIRTPIWETSIERARENIARFDPGCRELYGKILDKMAARVRGAPKHAAAPEKVAARIHHALTARRPRTRYLVGIDARIGALAVHLPDRWRDWLLSR